MIGEEEFDENLNKFNVESCVVCLINFENSEKIRKIPECEHIFHS